MSLNLIPCRSQYIGNGSATAFSTVFAFLSDSVVTASLNDANGNLVNLSGTITGAPLVQGTDFTVSGGPATVSSPPAPGTVTFTTAPPSGFLITIIRVTPLVQLTTFEPNDALPASALEDGLDLATMQEQEVSSPGGTVDRAIKFPPTEPTGFNSILPVFQARENTIFGFDANGAITLLPVSEFEGEGGSQGPAGTISVGTVTTVAYTSGAAVTNSGSSTNATLNFQIPQGTPGTAGSTGSAATVAVGTTTTGAAGSMAAVTNSGTSSAAVLNFAIPAGQTGATGPSGTGGVKSINIQKLTATGTYTPSANLLFAVVEVQGGGGGGGGAYSPSGNAAAGSGGNSGGYAKSVLSATTIGGSTAVTVGAAGTGGAGTNNGSGGGNSSFGTLVGNGGFFGLAGGYNASGFLSAPSNGNATPATGGNLANIGGAFGQPGIVFSSSSALPGNGASSPLGQGACNSGVLAGSSSFNGNAPTTGYGYGGGGSGACAVGSGSYAGGNGAPGVVIVTEYLSV